LFFKGETGFSASSIYPQFSAWEPRLKDFRASWACTDANIPEDKPKEFMVFLFGLPFLGRVGVERAVLERRFLLQ
jgi:hypothetical protein